MEGVAKDKFGNVMYRIGGFWNEYMWMEDVATGNREQVWKKPEDPENKDR